MKLKKSSANKQLLTTYSATKFRECADHGTYRACLQPCFI